MGLKEGEPKENGLIKRKTEGRWVTIKGKRGKVG
jgi:hypothetical protein